MFERHHLIHYDFNQIWKYNKENILENYLKEENIVFHHEDSNNQTFHQLMDTSDFLLSGSADVLPFYPQPEEELSKYSYVQSFSCMHSTQAYYTHRANYASLLLCYTHTGSGLLQYDGSEYILNEGDLFIINCMKDHSYKTYDSQWTHSDLHIFGPHIDLLYQEFLSAHHNSCVKRLAGEVYLKHLNLLLDAVKTPSRHRGLIISNQIETLLVQLIVDDSLQNTPATTEIYQIISYLIQYIQHHYNEDLNLDFLSKFSGISKYHLSRVFHEYSGFSPNEYIIQVRMDHARFLLKNTSCSVKNIGLMVGIENEAYFSRLFKKRHGVTPGAYRNSNLPV